MDPDTDGPSCCFDEWASANARRARSKETVAGVTKHLVGALRSTGLEGRTVLDIGCGVGDLLLALLTRGARSGTGIDLGSGGIGKARELAASRGLADRTAFVVGDGAEATLPPSDIVVLNRVVCCYPDVAALIGNATGAARAVLAFTAPIDRGVRGVFNRLSARWANRWYALRPAKYRGFRTFVHDLDSVERAVRTAGFERVRDERVRGVWRLEVFTRHAGPPPGITTSAAVAGVHAAS